MKLLKIVFVLFIMSSCTAEDVQPDLSNQKVDMKITNELTGTEGEDTPIVPPPPPPAE